MLLSDTLIASSLFADTFLLYADVTFLFARADTLISLFASLSPDTTSSSISIADFMLIFAILRRYALDAFFRQQQCSLTPRAIDTPATPTMFAYCRLCHAFSYTVLLDTLMLSRRYEDDDAADFSSFTPPC